MNNWKTDAYEAHQQQVTSKDKTRKDNGEKRMQAQAPLYPYIHIRIH